MRQVSDLKIKGMTQASFAVPTEPLSKDEAQQWQTWARGISPGQLQWLSGYLTGIQHSSAQLLELIRDLPALAPAEAAVTDKPKVTVLFGSKTGNGKQIAGQLQAQLADAGFEVALQDMNRYKPADLEKEQTAILIVSTHGEGDPPPSAEDLHAFLHSRKAPQLPNLRFAVLALGDRSYASFCQTGKEFDQRLEALGGKRLAARIDADVDYQDAADSWIADILNILQQNISQKTNLPQPALHVRAAARNGKTAESFNRKRPYQAEVLDKVLLNGRGSAKKTYHAELSLGDSGLTYQPGDTLGIYADNDPALVSALTADLGLNAEKQVTAAGKDYPLNEWLTGHAELTTVSGVFLQNYRKLASDKGFASIADGLSQILDAKDRTSAFTYGKDVWDVLRAFPIPVTEQELTGMLLPVQPRLYSIASALSAYPGEVHVTVGKVTYAHNDRLRTGLVSGFIADQLQAGGKARVFIDQNESFRLPESGDLPVIMVGPGTGVAPFRAFLQERQETGARGKNWLFFGDQHFSTDFLYQLEWQRFLKDGVLTRLNTAFSRDTRQKVYVQHRMQEHAATLYEWLEEGARFYVCGDAKRMAKDVKQTLIGIIAEQAGVENEKAAEYVKELIRHGRYMEDVY